MRALWALLFVLWVSSTAFAAPAVDSETAIVFIESFVETPDPSTGELKQTKVGEGTGFIIHSAGWVITAAHVIDIEAPPEGKVSFRGAVRSRHAQMHALEAVPGAQVSSDFAILRFPAGLGIQFPFLCVVRNPSIANGDSIKGLGFPFGWDLSVRPGRVTSIGGQAGLIQANMNLAPGMSGGPVLNDQNQVIGIIRGGISGQPGFDVFLPVNYALPLFDAPPATYSGSAGCPASPASDTATIERLYPISETNDSHGVTSSSRDYRIVKDADPGYQIVEANVIQESATRVSDLTVTIASDRKSVEVRFRLTAGPAYDRYRGWLHGQLALRMKPSN